MPPYTRPNFFSGRLLTADDLREEQQYQKEKRKLHNRYLHGWGVVFGLEIMSSNRKLYIDAGLALDCEGNEIIIPDRVELDPPFGSFTCENIYVGVCYRETPIGTAIASANNQLTSIAETYEVVFQQDNSNRGHRHSSGRWRTCGELHPITIGRLRKTAGFWRIDRRYGPATVK